MESPNSSLNIIFARERKRIRKRKLFPPKMSFDPEDKATSSPKSERPLLNPPPAPPSVAAFMMDLDLDLELDLESSWSSDEIFTNLTSPFQLSNSEQPCSPLWAFNDENNDCKPAGNSVPGGGFRLSNCSRRMPYATNPESMTENGVENDDKRKLPSPLLGLRPIDNPDESCIIKERMTQALRYFKDLTGEHVLAQVWAPVKNGGRYVLTTSEQPFVLDSDSNGLHQYRLVSLMYTFSVDGEADGALGLPGRVFWQRLPEWTPNVQYYSSNEFPRLGHALNYNVRGTLALPVFEPSRQSCVGVIELIMTSQKINYAPEVDKVCKALEAVNLKSSEILDHPSTQICNEGRQNALAEILEILTVVCENHTLPLAQTWIPCRHRNVLADGGGFKKTCSSFDGSCMGQVCMSTTDVAYYVVDAHMWGFREACTEHHLRKGQGVVGRAFASHNLHFCDDITQFCKTEYPLVHYARMFGLKSSVAICLRSTNTGNDDYVLEFFLPPNVQDHNNQRTLLDAILLTMRQHFGSLRVASGNDPEREWRSIEITKASMDEKLNSRLDFATNSPPKSAALPNEEAVHLHSSEKRQLVEFNTTNNEGSAISFVENKDTGKKSERKRGKAEKTISLEVLQQYFAGSLKDAAKSLGVCPTTMKRICRQHGISRWPSRKINRVNRSLSKLKHVIESVQGAEGAFTLTSLAASSIPVDVGSISWSASIIEPNQQSSPGPIPPGGDELVEALGTVELIPQQTETLLGEGSNRSKSGSRSREESTGTPTSYGSCQNNHFLGIENSRQNDPVVTPVTENHIKPTSSLELACQPTQEINLSVALSIPKPNAFVTAPQEPFGGMLIEDAGSSHDLRNLCPAGETLFDEHVPEYSWTKPPRSDAVPSSTVVSVDPTPQFSARAELKTITVKATYREDIIRFRLSLGLGIINLKEEVANRLKLEVGTFDIKYLDDDQEWVLIACDADLQECIDISRSSGRNIIRLFVHDIMVNIGSSCDSSGE